MSLWLRGGVLALAFAAWRAVAAPVAAGFATVDITPGTPIRLASFEASRPHEATNIGQRLHAKAIAIGTRESACVLVVFDGVGVHDFLAEAVRDALAAEGVARERVAVCATHTHSGPALLRPLTPGGEAADPGERRRTREYTESLRAKLVQVARAALADRRPAQLLRASGRAGFAVNRRVIVNGRWRGFGANPDGPVDHALPLLIVRDPGDGALRGVVLSYAAHGTTLGGNGSPPESVNLVHGDWPGLARETIEARHPGATALVLIGCAGDQNPAERHLAATRRYATEIADEVDRLLRGPARDVGAPREARWRQVELEFDPPTPDEWRTIAQEGRPRERDYAARVLEQIGRGASLPKSARYAVQSWAFGDDLLMVFLAGEPAVEYGLRLKRELRDAWPIGYANEYAGYIASRRMIPEGGYEVAISMYNRHQPGPYAADTEDRIVEAVRAMAPRRFVMPAPAAP